MAPRRRAETSDRPRGVRGATIGERDSNLRCEHQRAGGQSFRQHNCAVCIGVLNIFYNLEAINIDVVWRRGTNHDGKHVVRDNALQLETGVS